MHNQSHKNKLIDTHSHLAISDYDVDRDDVLKRAWTAGLEAVVVIGSGDGLAGNKRALEFASANENVYATVGIHPNDAETVDINEAIKEVRDLATNKKVVAIGEIGLDYYRTHASREVQRKCFEKFLELAIDLKMPVTIHDRDAHMDTIYMLREYENGLSGGIFHCFSGDVQMAHEVTELGFYIAIPGVVTFSKADVLRQVVSELPVERMVLETDCPYLAPEPFRGKRNEPAYVPYIAEEIAKIKKLSLEDVARITTINARRIFDLPGAMPIGEIAYAIRNSLYINLTNKCSLACTFCPKQSKNFEVKGHNLKLEHEPNVEDVFRAIGDVSGYEEVVFCGFGEPTLRLELLKEIARELKQKNMKVRLDTDGLMNLVYGRNAVSELEGLIDAVSVSMNAPDAETYMRLCPSKYGKRAFEAVIEFLKLAKKYIPDVTASAVGIHGLNIPACESLAKEIGVKFRLRKYQDVG